MHFCFIFINSVAKHEWASAHLRETEKQNCKGKANELRFVGLPLSQPALGLNPATFDRAKTTGNKHTHTCSQARIH